MILKSAEHHLHLVVKNFISFLSEEQEELVTSPEAVTIQ